MASSDDDADLKLALAMSMQHESPVGAKHSSANNETVDLTSDTEDENDEDMRKAIAMSLQEPGVPERPKQPVVESSSRAKSTPSTAAHVKDTSSSQSNTSVTTNEVPSKPAGMIGLDRKAMEEERLARIGKRKREPSPERPLKQVAKPLPSQVKQTLPLRSQASRDILLQYPRGAVKRTAATKFPRTDDITIDEVLQAESLNIAVISSFMWDSEWLNAKLDPRKVKQLWIMNAKGEDIQQRWRREMEAARIPNMKLHFPPMHGITHSMHSKFLLLFGKDKLRIVIPTANMTPFDWGEVKNDWQPGVMENSMFLIDLPRNEDGTVGDRKDLTQFGKEIIHFLEKQEVGTNVVEGLLKHDFSLTDHLAFVHSIGGAHKGELQHPTGLPGLTKAINELQLGDVKSIELDYAASSLGAINDAFLQRIYLAACGKSPSPASIVPNVRDHLRIYFPTEEAVQKSIGGPDCGGVISLTRQFYNAATFPRECMRNYDSTRRGMLSHNKLLFARGVKNNGEQFAWVYVGSANISESAWGGQKVLKSGQLGSLNIRNWECGVVMPVPSDKLAGLSEGEMPPMGVFEGTVEVPFVTPGQLYGDGQPWFFLPGR